MRKHGELSNNFCAISCLLGDMRAILRARMLSESEPGLGSTTCWRQGLRKLNWFELAPKRVLVSQDIGRSGAGSTRTSVVSGQCITELDVSIICLCLITFSATKRRAAPNGIHLPRRPKYTHLGDFKRLRFERHNLVFKITAQSSDGYSLLHLDLKYQRGCGIEGHKYGYGTMVREVVLQCSSIAH